MNKNLHEKLCRIERLIKISNMLEEISKTLFVLGFVLLLIGCLPGFLS